MKITFPHLGDTYIAARLFLQEIGVDVVIPTLNSTKVLENGSKYAPEEMCLPFKLMIANYISAYEQGADTALMVSTMGPCRLGEYGELLKSILDKNGYSLNWIIIDTPHDIGVKELLRRLAFVVQDSHKNTAQILSSLAGVYRVIKRFEKLGKKAAWMSGYEIEKGAYKKLVQECKKEISEAPSIKEALKIIGQYHKLCREIKIDKYKKPIKVILTGEIYSLIEPFANNYIEEKLMDMGVSYEKQITVGWWIDHTVVNPFGLYLAQKRKNEYLDYCIGGYAKETIEDGIKSKTKKFDGVIQIFPVGCMPEIVSKSILTQMSKEMDIRVLTVIFDEMNGEAGYITRIEAFIDMLSRRKKLAVRS